MMKTLSSSNTRLRIVFTILRSLFGVIIVLIALNEYTFLKNLVLLGVLIVAIVWSYKQYIYSYNLFYNEINLILKNVREERYVDLLDIKRVKLAHTQMRILGFQFYEYKIEFANESNIPETITFFVTDMNSRLSEFQNILKLKSQSVIIENYT